MTNMALPGAGSLLAGRVSGYAQLALAVAGLALSVIFGVPFIFWALTNWSRLHDQTADPIGGLLEIWQHLRWALLSLGIFGAGWLWGLATSFLILRAAQKAEARKTSPLL